jgi:predicted Rdx family selenoprotein
MQDYQWELSELKLITGGRGIFDVRLDDELLFSKHSVKRFPTYEDIRGQLISLIGPPAEREED